MRRILSALTLLVSLLAASTGAEEPVPFIDATLKAAVEDTLWVSDPTPTDMLGLTTLTCLGDPTRDGDIVSLSGLEYAVNLQNLDLEHHQISDLSPLSGLNNLRTLNLQRNSISSLAPLAHVPNLQTLFLRFNRISDISPLSHLVHLTTLSLHRNLVGDISPLTSLTCLKWLDLRINPLTEEAYSTYIAQICANNPGLQFYYDPHFRKCVVIESTRGGSVTAPGEGEFTYSFGELILLAAQAEPGFVFAGWSGKFSDAGNPTYLFVDHDFFIRANFVSVLDTIHVAANAPADPGPGDPGRSDPQEDGTPEHPFDRIQEAIDVAAPGVLILVQPGTYHENIDLRGKSVRLMGAGAEDMNRPAFPVIQGYNKIPAVSFTGGEHPDCQVTGFVITASEGQPASAIHCFHSSPTIAHCLIVGNRSRSTASAAVHCTNSKAVLANCTIADNYADAAGAAVTLIDSDVAITNSILWGNSPREILVRGASYPAIRYCDVQGSWPGMGNLNNDPLFARRGAWVSASDPGVVLGPQEALALWVGADYHLQSQAGRWDPQTPGWVRDAVSSPGIDAGDRTSPVGAEPAPNGGVINLGAYGGTSEASKSYNSGS